MLLHLDERRSGLQRSLFELLVEIADRFVEGPAARDELARDRTWRVQPARADRVRYQPTSGPGLLKTPDGFDLVARGGTTPAHPTTG